MSVADQEEIELKFIARRDRVFSHPRSREVAPIEIEQIYLNLATVRVLPAINLLMPSVRSATEIRVRRTGRVYTLTAKQPKTSVSRLESEVGISEAFFDYLVALCPASQGLEKSGIRKLRWSMAVRLYGRQAQLDIDEYLDIRGQRLSRDFVVCEIECRTYDDARVVRSQSRQDKEWPFLSCAIDVTDDNAWKNATLAANGMKWVSFAQIEEHYAQRSRCADP